MTAPSAPEVELGSLLYTLPSPSGGRLCVTGTGISVRQVSLMFQEGLSPAEIADQYAPHLPLEGVHAAIAYYLANRVRMDAELEVDEDEADRLFAHHALQGKFPDAPTA